VAGVLSSYLIATGLPGGRAGRPSTPSVPAVPMGAVKPCPWCMRLGQGAQSRTNRNGGDHACYRDRRPGRLRA
jgi:hypothetical protein